MAKTKTKPSTKNRSKGASKNGRAPSLAPGEAPAAIPGAAPVSTPPAWEATSHTEFSRLLGEARSLLPKAGLPVEPAAEVDLDFLVIEQQALRDPPNLRLIRSRLEGIGEILQGQVGARRLSQVVERLARLAGGIP